MRKVVLALIVLATALTSVSVAQGFLGRMRGQADLTGKLSDQTVKVNGSVFFEPGEDDAVVCLVLTQNGHKATGCSKTLRYSPDEVTFPATLKGSGLVPGAAALRATATYEYYDAKGEHERTWTWNNPGFMLVDANCGLTCGG